MGLGIILLVWVWGFGVLCVCLWIAGWVGLVFVGVFDVFLGLGWWFVIWVVGWFWVGRWFCDLLVCWFDTFLDCFRCYYELLGVLVGGWVGLLWWLGFGLVLNGLG